MAAQRWFIGRREVAFSLGNTISFFLPFFFCPFFPFQEKRENRSRTNAPRRIITHTTRCSTTIEAETAELIEDIVYRYFLMLRARQWYAIVLQHRRLSLRWCEGPMSGSSRFSSFVINLSENDDYPRQFTEECSSILRQHTLEIVFCLRFSHILLIVKSRTSTCSNLARNINNNF